MQRFPLVAAGLAGAAAIALAALGAHAAGEARPILDSAALLLGWHAPALLALGLWGASGFRLAATLLAIGVAMFAVALTLRAFAGLSLGPVAPLGGAAMIAGWLWIAVTALRR